MPPQIRCLLRYRYAVSRMAECFGIPGQTVQARCLRLPSTGRNDMMRRQDIHRQAHASYNMWTTVSLVKADTLAEAGNSPDQARCQTLPHRQDACVSRAVAANTVACSSCNGCVFRDTHPLRLGVHRGNRHRPLAGWYRKRGCAGRWYKD